VIYSRPEVFGGGGSAVDQKPTATTSIVIIHGLQGHPFKTWAHAKGPSTPASSRARSHQEPAGSATREHSNILRGMLSRLSRKPSVKGQATKETGSALFGASKGGRGKRQPVFWPADLLPEDCPNSRILMYGYDTKITKYMTGATNRSNVFSHGKDLIFALARERVPDRPLVFVAHSLGGIVVKEVRPSRPRRAITEVVN
jgi:hypothetical protein